MDFISNQKAQVNAMLEAIGAGSIEELFASIPQNLKHRAPHRDDGLSESEGVILMEEIAAKNTFSSYESYLGAGAYEHYLPAVIGFICSKSEFLTAYTPYQPEASQGMLQATFEFQSAICALTGMDVSNASLYDGATACAEAMLMALRYQKERNKVVIASSLHPHYFSVVKQFLSSHGTLIERIPFDKDGSLDRAKAEALIDDQTSAVLLPYPSFFGVIDEIKQISAKAKACGSLMVVCANPLVYGLYASAEEIGADIAVGDIQPLGLPLQFGGPYCGYMACRQDLVRQMPGRIVGETIDAEGKRGFVLTLQAREQHIRREKATSNICTNQALAALASLVCMLWYGRQGLRELALTNYQRTAYLRHRLGQLPGVVLMGNAPFFNEFALSFGYSGAEAFEHFRHRGIEPGLDLGKYYPEFNGYLLVAVTETKTKGMLDRYIQVASELMVRK